MGKNPQIPCSQYGNIGMAGEVKEARSNPEDAGKHKHKHGADDDVQGGWNQGLEGDQEHAGQQGSTCSLQSP